MTVMTSHKEAWDLAAAEILVVLERAATELPDAPMAMPVQSLARVSLSDLMRGLTAFGARRARS